MLLTFDSDILEIFGHDSRDADYIPDGTYKPITFDGVFELAPTTPDSGYFVSVPFMRPNMPVPDYWGSGGADINYRVAAAETARLGAIVQRAALVSNNYLGVWRDGGALYVDLSVWVPTLGAAVSLARAGGELAIWDIADGKALTVADLTGEVLQ